MRRRGGSRAETLAVFIAFVTRQEEENQGEDGEESGYADDNTYDRRGVQSDSAAAIAIATGIRDVGGSGLSCMDRDRRCCNRRRGLSI